MNNLTYNSQFKLGIRFSPPLISIIIPIHVLGILALYFLIWHFSWWYLPVIWLGWFVTGCLGTEIGLHRLFSHNAFSLKSTPLRWFLGWAACMAGQWSPLFWAALHRGYHHPGCDTERDIHSPVRGKWNAYMGWMSSLQESEVNLLRAKYLASDPMHQFLHKHYTKVFWISLSILWLGLGTQWFLIGAVLPVLLAMHQVNIVNLFCHIATPFGYRNFETADKSMNIYVLGLLFWGEGFHNNHHAKPDRYNFGIRSNEIDVCRWVVPALVLLDRIAT